ncbi:hypothetical protein AC480_03335 [miscellaneous Crenarchaeota group archaeon SMTZ1-55]|nr:MAG: hypothetical protein AC480_03335 [miscellaneous Crenarchaeota group archaeon SMTZ1-55]
MPYITQEKRPLYRKEIEALVKKLTEQPVTEQDGDVNYIVTSILKQLYAPRYFNYNRAIGVLEAIKQEYYRRVVAPYEDTKIRDNGDVP